MFCEICGGDALVAVNPQTNLTYWACKGCEHCIQDFQNASLSETIAVSQATYFGDDSELLNYQSSPFEEEALSQRMKSFAKYAKVPSRCLEVGPGAGQLSKRLSMLGHAVTSIEFSPELARKLSELEGLNVVQGDFEALTLGADQFDAFFSIHVIEHVASPRSHLEKALSVTSLGGYAVLATPNAASWQQRYFRSLSPNFDLAHLRVFSARSLTQLCEAVGWAVVSVSTPENSADWARVLTKVVRRVRGEDETATAGKYASGSSPIIQFAYKAFQALTKPLRWVQSSMGSGNEVLLILQKR